MKCKYILYVSLIKFNMTKGNISYNSLVSAFILVYPQVITYLNESQTLDEIVFNHSAHCV